MEDPTEEWVRESNSIATITLEERHKIISLDKGTKLQGILTC
jgi:hypothetical protein